jgi:protein JSN1
VKGASTIPADQQVLGGAVENYRSNLLLSMIAAGAHTTAYISDGLAKPPGWTPSVTEQQMIMQQLSAGSVDAEADVLALAGRFFILPTSLIFNTWNTEFRPPTMYYTTIPLVSERPHNRRWDASKLRELRKRLDSGTMTVEEIDQVASDFLEGEIVDLASDWLGNTVCYIHEHSLPLLIRVARSSKNFSKGALRFRDLPCWNASRPIWR